MSVKARGAAYAASAAAIWGGMYVVSDVVLPTIPPFTLLTIRLLTAILVLGLLTKRSGAALPQGRTIISILGIGFIGFGISIGAQFVGTDLSNSMNGALITSASPAFILLFALPVLGESITRRHMVAVALATLGVVIIVDLSQINFSSDTFVGNLSLALAALSWGLYSVLVRRASRDVDTMMFSFLAPIGGLFLTIPAAGIELGSRPIGEITVGVLLGILYLGLISTAVAMFLWNRAFALIEASTASLFFFAQPLVGALLSVFLLGQQMTLSLWIGSALILVGVFLSLGRDRRAELRPVVRVTNPSPGFPE